MLNREGASTSTAHRNVCRRPAVSEGGSNPKGPPMLGKAMFLIWQDGEPAGGIFLLNGPLQAEVRVGGTLHVVSFCFQVRSSAFLHGYWQIFVVPWLQRNIVGFE